MLKYSGRNVESLTSKFAFFHLVIDQVISLVILGGEHVSTTEWVPYVQSDQTKSWLSGKKISKLEGLHGRERWEIKENDMTDIQGMNS